ncbi:MAG: valine--tRNA ligase [Candidatus Zixiibacteriota bacterium]|nr:MAG: valine--tRNA ligase [candidate division Zixibacteria bacterium]
MNTKTKKRVNSKAEPYDPKAVESRLLGSWLEAGYFKGEINKDKEPYSIVIPPPNVTDILHLGHALNNTIQDILIRQKRMSGFEAEWLPGADHAGIATQVVVEKQLKKEGTTRRELGREKFLERTRILAYKNKDYILDQLKKIGCSCDWERTRFTIDESLSRAVLKVFIHLYEKGLIYRGHRIVNWCPSCQTSLSDDEVEHEEKQGSLWYIKYKLKGSDQFLTVATTRPETMLGDTALAVNPKDTKYKRYVGKTAILPILERELPIIADSYVDPEFGTGVVKITPAHDPNDFEIGKRHDLEEVNILNNDGTLNANAGKFKGLDRYDARKQLVKELEKKGYLEKIDKYDLAVGTCYRCHQEIEPYLSDQWFVRMAPLAKPATEALKKGDLRFHPDYWSKTYLHWMENIKDWCISRQLWWGHRIPVYYCECGETIVAEKNPEKCPKCGGADITQDEDVLDTWFSSWLWPFSTMGWPEKDPLLDYFYPTRVLVTASEIIFLWVARMVMAGYEFVGKIPFNDVYIHGTVRDANGIKMSKSLGNGIDPLEIIDQHGADALRISLVLATPDGQDPWMSKNTFEVGRNFVNKLYQAARFVMLRIGDTRFDINTIPENDLILVDKWILSRLERTIEATNRSIEEFKLSAAAKNLYSFTWNDFCSWYIELIKPDKPDQPIRETSLNVAFYVLDKILKLLHPFIPFVTEEINLKLREYFSAKEDTLTFGPWPEQTSKFKDDSLEASFETIQSVVNAVRSIRAEMNVPPGKRSDLHVRVTDEAMGKLLEKYQDYFRSLAKINNLIIGSDIKKPGLSASAVISGAEIFVPLEGLINIDDEKKRLEKELANLKAQLERISKKLANPDFLKNAPTDIINREKNKKADIEERVEKLNTNLEQLLGW